MIETLKIGTLRWHHVMNPTEEDLQFFADDFHFHMLDLEDCRSRLNQRPKVDIYDDYYFMILHFPNIDKSGKNLQTKEVKIFWGEDYLITIGSSDWVVMKMFREAQEQAARKEEFEIGTSDALLYRILERLMRETMVLLRKIGNDVEFLNSELFNIKSRELIERISITRKNIILLNTIFKPQLPLFQRFEIGKIEGYAENMEDYWGNILDYYQKMWDMTEDYQELIEGLSKTFDSLQAHKINDIMKVLTFFSTILLPLTFITGLYGMNVGLPLQNDPNSFFIVLIAMVVIVVVMLLYFKRKRWI
ncbi:MAG: magnesium transporter CorA family protein [Bacteroidales bacterium]|nr:magnesium transporter CorA family protein [Bacteroidales bacterium]